MRRMPIGACVRIDTHQSSTPSRKRASKTKPTKRTRDAWLAQKTNTGTLVHFCDDHHQPLATCTCPCGPCSKESEVSTAPSSPAEAFSILGAPREPLVRLFSLALSTPPCAGRSSYLSLSLSPPSLHARRTAWPFHFCATAGALSKEPGLSMIAVELVVICIISHQDRAKVPPCLAPVLPLIA